MKRVSISSIDVGESCRLISKALSRGGQEDQKVTSGIKVIVEEQISLGLKTFPVAWEFDKVRGVSIGKDLRHLYVVLSLMRMADAGAVSVADVGCGKGRYKRFCNGLGYTYVGYDMEDSKDLKKGDKIDFCVTDISSEEFVPRESDVILLTEVIEHMVEPVRLLKRLLKLLSRDERLIITAPYTCREHQAPHYYYNGFHPRLISEVTRSEGKKIESEVFLEFGLNDVFMGFTICPG